MGNWCVVSKDLAQKFWIPVQDFKVFSRQSLCPVAFDELDNVCHLAPIFFVKEGEDEGTFIPVLLLGFLPEQNLFLGPKGEWLGKELPWAFKAFPFNLGKTQDGNYVLLIDEEHLSDTPKPISFSLFREDGNLAPEVTQIAQFLFLRENGYARCRELATILGRMELLTPYSFVLDFGREKKRIEGLYRLDMQKFVSLDDSSFLKLRQNQALHLIYAHLFSLTNFSRLVDLWKLRQKTVSSAGGLQQKALDLSQTQDLEKMLKEIKFPNV